MKNIPPIHIRVLPHKQQRYDTCGDYYAKKGALEVRISKMHADFEFLVLIHELVEWYLTQKNGVTIEDIDRFDKAFTGEGEPGDDINAPYFHEHQFATYLEKQLAEKLGVNWSKYDKYVDKL